jgi:hypothetical protein
VVLLQCNGNKIVSRSHYKKLQTPNTTISQTQKKMKKHLLFLILIVAACKTNLTNPQKKYPEFKIENIHILTEKETVSINELRFHRIKSAMNTIKLIYKNYGKWDKKITGKHQGNIKKFI